MKFGKIRKLNQGSAAVFADGRGIFAVFSPNHLLARMRIIPIRWWPEVCWKCPNKLDWRRSLR